MGDRKDTFVLVTTPLADVEFHMQSMVGKEQLGRPFRYDFELLTKSDDVDPLKLLGNPITAELELDKGKRYFNGLVSEISSLGRGTDFSQYSVTVRPWLWFLTRCSDNKIFQNLDVLEIIKKVFQDNKFSDFKIDTIGTFRKRDYCVQYGETNFDFVSRLMEEEGIYYYHAHTKGKHELILADSPSAHKSVADEKIPFRPTQSAGTDLDHISRWAWSRKVQTQKFTLESYDFTNPKSELKAERKAEDKKGELGKHGQSGKERYEYGQLYVKAADGSSLATVRIEEQMADYAVARGDGNARALSSGYKFNLVEHPGKDQDGDYLIVDAQYEIQNNAVETAGGRAETSFDCSFTAIDSKAHFRPARITPKSLVRGPQTAVVVGPSGKEISTDEYGRVKVQFHWDRVGKKDQDSSCFIRVAQAWAGGTWGAFSLPRHGQEVIVDFLEGDPDQPIITGSVYHKDNMVPFALPTNQTQSGLRTRSSPDGDAQTFNELRFEDKKGSEEIFLQAERDFKRVVENNDTLVVGNKSKDAKDGKHGYDGVGNQTITIYNDRTATLEKGNDSLTIDEGNRTATVKKGDDELKVESGSQKIDVKKKINIIAGDELTITVGQASLTMKKNGDITMKGM
ncbi:MAG: type VI secretion system tip protein VgrG, partial [Xanthomonadales bacterium]|nr:type VI secretion system tip protein VgrG [Xanthomonadales bacterium]